MNNGKEELGRDGVLFVIRKDLEGRRNERKKRGRWDLFL